MIYLLIGMTGIFYYYKHQIMYNAMWYYTYISENLRYYFTPEEIARENCVSFDYLELLNSCDTVFSKLNLKNREFISMVSECDIKPHLNNYLETGNNYFIERLENCKSEFLTVSADVIFYTDSSKTKEYKKDSFIITDLFHKFYFPGNRIVLNENTREAFLKLIEYEYSLDLGIDDDSVFDIEYLIITMNSKIYQGKSMILNITDNGDLKVVLSIMI
tara:strand:+ start:854 stop:1504 length:651 start_codon:yes stop_codon:yes gene_type:complete